MNPPPPLASVTHTIRLVLIVAGVALVGFLQNQRAPFPINGSRLPLYFTVIALQLLFVWFVRKGVRAYGLSLRDLFGRRWGTPLDAVRDIIIAVGFVLLLEACTLFAHRIFGSPRNHAAFLLPERASETIVWIGLAVLAGFSEEIVYRGYLQTQLHALTKSLPGAVVLQAFVFAAAHLYQGWRPLLSIALYGIAFGLLAIWRRSILPGAIAHAAIDLIGGLFPSLG